MLTADRLRELLDYAPETGSFTWRNTSRRAVAGAAAGSDNGEGYTQISVDGRRYAAHRLAWLYVHGEWPASELDHIDGQRSHNAIANLRLADRFLNNRNVHRARQNSKTGLLGVSPKGRRFVAQIRANGVNHYLGRFDTAEQAHEAYMAAKQVHHQNEE